MSNILLIEKFYKAFSEGDAEAMVSCYSEDIQFEDPAFGKLQGHDAKNMWRMLIERGKGGIKITYSNIQAGENSGSCNWVAEYSFGATGRKVVNRITARFEFKDGKIVYHKDHFDLWKWSQQALGWKGYLLGWTAFMKNKIQKQSNSLLKAYNQKNLHGTT